MTDQRDPSLAGPALQPATRYHGEVRAVEPVSETMFRIRVDLEADLEFQPGQFCMLNGVGGGQFVLGRPFSILDASGRRVDLLFKVVGGGTAHIAEMRGGDPVQLLGPLGTAFPAAQPQHRYLLLAGGVGLPPLYAWRRRYPDADCRACFGAREGGEVPWAMLDHWSVSLDRAQGIPDGLEPFIGNVVQLAASFPERDEPGKTCVLACGPPLLLSAAAALAAERGWDCRLSTEERMGCGYGACRGCVVPAAVGGYLTACQDGPVFDAADIRIGDL